MMKEILKQWLLTNCDCEEGTLEEPWILLMNRSGFDVAKLAQFILDNPCTD